MPDPKRLALKATYRFLKDDVFYGTLLYRYRVSRHRALVQKAERSQRHTHTRFYRSPGQLEALTGPVMQRLLAGRPPETLQINVFASSTGAEPYTLASVLVRKFPQLQFQITASDLHREMVDHATNAIYSTDEVRGRAPPEDFITDTFDRVGESYRVRSELRRYVTVKQQSAINL